MVRIQIFGDSNLEIKLLSLKRIVIAIVSCFRYQSYNMLNTIPHNLTNQQTSKTVSLNPFSETAIVECLKSRTFAIIWQVNFISIITERIVVGM